MIIVQLKRLKNSTSQADLATSVYKKHLQIMTYRTSFRWSPWNPPFPYNNAPIFPWRNPAKSHPLLVQRWTHESRGSCGRTERQKWLCHLGRRKRPGPCCGNGLDLTYVCINPCISIDSYIYIYIVFLMFDVFSFIHLFVYLFIHLFICLCIYLFVYLTFICLKSTSMMRRSTFINNGDSNKDN